MRMRFLVFFVGVVGSLLAGFGGWFWLDYTTNRAIEQMLQDYKEYGADEVLAVIMPDFEVYWNTTCWAALFLLAGAVLGLLGSLLTLLRRGRHGAVLMLLAVMGPLILNPVTFAFTAVLAFAGLLSFFVRPLPPRAPVSVTD
jgi:hypothetical protein